MVILQVLLTVLLLASLTPSPLAEEVEDCPINREPDFRDSVVNAVCEFAPRTPVGASFRAETRKSHNKTERMDFDGRYILISLFADKPTIAGYASSCHDVHRENVTWCVRIAHINKSIETCISLDDDQQPVYKSTCDAKLLNLEKHLFLPAVQNCSFFGSGCLGLINMDWIFKDAYLTCILQTDTCSEVTFFRSLTRININRPPEITQITISPLRVQPSERIIIHVTTIAYSQTFFSWHHDNSIYSEYIYEDPFCQPHIEECHPDLHPIAENLKKQHVSFYLYSQQYVLPGCVGSVVTISKSYIIIDNATASDAGTYALHVDQFLSEELISEVNVTIECDESSFYQTTCTHETIVVDKGKHTEWICELNAPSNSSISVMFNKVVPLSSAELTGKDDLDTVCNKEPGVVYHVVENPDHVCYSRFTVRVVVCATTGSEVGNYSVVWSNGNATAGEVNLKITPQVLATPGILSKAKDLMYMLINQSFVTTR